MFKRYLVIAALALLAFGATQASALDFEQKSFYAQGMISMPIGDWSDFVNMGFGGGVGMHVPHNEQMSFRGEVSYIYYGTDSDFFGDDYDVSANSIPILALVQYNMTDSPFYLVGGLGFVMQTVDVEYNGAFGSFSSDDSSTELGLVAGAGYAVNEKLAIEGRFSLVSDANSLNVGGVLHF